MGLSPLLCRHASDCADTSPRHTTKSVSLSRCNWWRSTWSPLRCSGQSRSDRSLPPQWNSGFRQRPPSWSPGQDSNYASSIDGLRVVPNPEDDPKNTRSVTENESVLDIDINRFFCNEGKYLCVSGRTRVSFLGNALCSVFLFSIPIPVTQFWREYIIQLNLTALSASRSIKSMCVIFLNRNTSLNGTGIS